MHRWARLGSGAVLPRDGKGCVQRGACHPSRSAHGGPGAVWGEGAYARRATLRPGSSAG